MREISRAQAGRRYSILLHMFVPPIIISGFIVLGNQLVYSNQWVHSGIIPEEQVMFVPKFPLCACRDFVKYM